MTTKFKYVSLFSGIGGFETALNRLGGECVMASEIDKFANQAYEVLYGEPTVGDVTKVAAVDVPDHDMLVGGFPCQSFSVAGKRLGFEDTRGTLFFEVARIAKVKRPKVVLLENVKGLISHDKGRTLDTIISALCDIGYTVDFNVLNSKYFGVPQNRERIFIVGVLGGEQAEWKPQGSGVVAKGKRRIAQIVGVKTFNFDWPEQVEVTTKLRDILEDNVDEKYYKEVLVNFFIENSLKQESRGNGFRFSPHVKDNAFVAKTLTTKAGARMDDNFILDDEKSESTNFTFSSKNEEFKHGKEYRIRKLTPLECFRLQGFPDEYHDKLTAANVSNSQLYKMAGNAVSVPVIDAIGRRLLRYLASSGAAYSDN